MTDENVEPPAGPLPARQTGSLRMRVGERVSVEAELTVTPAIFPAIGAMVGMILLGSAVIVHVARR